MPRYIDADAFDADCRKRYCTDCNNYNGVKCRACWVDDMLGEVDDAPTVSPDEVRSVGKWIDKPYFTECSICHAEFDSEVTCSEIYGWPWLFCPSSGAKMEVASNA